MKTRFAVLSAILALLVGCAAAPPMQGGRMSYRDDGAMISSTLRFDLAQFAGDWIVRAYFPQGGALQDFNLKPEAGARFVFAETGAPATLVGQVTGAGRFKLDGRSREYWVLWVDEGFRTAAIGTPDGAFGYIIDRKPSGGKDRYVAAREILDFNGYDVSKLVVRK